MPVNDGMFIKKTYRHKKFRLEDKGVVAECSEDGKITLTEVHNKDEESVITIPASFVYLIANTLKNTVKVTSEAVPFNRRKDGNT